MPLVLLLVLLIAPAASARDEDEEAEGDGYGEDYEDKRENLVSGPLERTSRFSLQAGWRYTPNTKFFDTYYSKAENRGLTRADGTFGGPLVVGTFAYSPLEWLEVGFDLFFTYERMALTKLPPLNAISFGLMLGLRVQKRLELGPEGLIPFVGLLSGPTFAASYFPGGRSIENFAQALGFTAGATLLVTPEWGVNFEYRLTFARGEAERIGTYEAGGSWFAVGLTYALPKVKDRPLSRKF